ncbi:hypothetical protein [Stenotrophomonas phage RAS14]
MSIEGQIRETMAWLRSGNSVPVSKRDVTKNEKFWKDIDKLNEMVNNDNLNLSE